MASAEAGLQAAMSSGSTFELDSSIFMFPPETFIDSSAFGSYIVNANLVEFTYCQQYGASIWAGNSSTSNATFSVFPNPGASDFQIHSDRNFTDEELSKYEFTVFDLLGRRVHIQKLLRNNERVDLSLLPSATYIYP